MILHGESVCEDSVAIVKALIHIEDRADHELVRSLKTVKSIVRQKRVLDDFEIYSQHADFAIYDC